MNYFTRKCQLSGWPSHQQIKDNECSTHVAFYIADFTLRSELKAIFIPSCYLLSDAPFDPSQTPHSFDQLRSAIKMFDALISMGKQERAFVEVARTLKRLLPMSISKTPPKEGRMLAHYLIVLVKNENNGTAFMASMLKDISSLVVSRQSIKRSIGGFLLEAQRSNLIGDQYAQIAATMSCPEGFRAPILPDHCYAEPIFVYLMDYHHSKSLSFTTHKLALTSSGTSHEKAINTTEMLSDLATHLKVLQFDSPDQINHTSLLTLLFRLICQSRTYQRLAEYESSTLPLHIFMHLMRSQENDEPMLLIEIRNHLPSRRLTADVLYQAQKRVNLLKPDELKKLIERGDLMV